MSDRQQLDIARRRGAQGEGRRPVGGQPDRGWGADLHLADPPVPSDDFRVPRAWFRGVPTGTVMLGASGLGAALIRGSLPANPSVVWPLVVLITASMAYDLGLRALRQRQRRKR